MANKRERKWVSGGQLGVLVDHDTPDGLRCAICDILEPKETIIRALKRLRPTPGGKAGQRNKKQQQKKRNSKPKMRWERDDDDEASEKLDSEPEKDGEDDAGAKKQPDTKELFDRLTECAACLMDLGFEDIYTETREQIESSITGTYDGGRGELKGRGSFFVWHDDGDHAPPDDPPSARPPAHDPHNDDVAFTRNDGMAFTRNDDVAFNATRPPAAKRHAPSTTEGRAETGAREDHHDAMPPPAPSPQARQPVSLSTSKSSMPSIPSMPSMPSLRSMCPVTSSASSNQLPISKTAPPTTTPHDAFAPSPASDPPPRLNTLPPPQPPHPHMYAPMYHLSYPHATSPRPPYVSYGQSQSPYNYGQPPCGQSQPPYGQSQPPYGHSQPPPGSNSGPGQPDYGSSQHLQAWDEYYRRQAWDQYNQNQQQQQQQQQYYPPPPPAL